MKEGEGGREEKERGKKGRRWNNAAASPCGSEEGRGECLRGGGAVGMGIGGGSVRVGVRNRLGEAIGKPVANLHGRWTSAATVPREKGKKGTPVFSKSTDPSTLPSDPILIPPFFRSEAGGDAGSTGSGRGTKDRAEGFVTDFG